MNRDGGQRFSLERSERDLKLEESLDSVSIEMGRRDGEDAAREFIDELVRGFDELLDGPDLIELCRRRATPARGPDYWPLCR